MVYNTYKNPYASDKRLQRINNPYQGYNTYRALKEPKRRRREPRNKDVAFEALDKREQKAIIAEKVRKYKQDYRYFDKDKAQQLHAIARNFGMPFELAKPHRGEAGVASVVGHALKGYIQGFTTIHWGDRPDTTVERVASRVGSAAGFFGLGIAPLISAGSKVARAGFAAAGKAAKTARIAKKGAKAVKFAKQNRSVPLYLANKVLSGTGLKSAIRKIGGSKALGKSLGFLGENVTAGSVVESTVEDMVRVGLMNAVSSWQQGFGGMVKGFAGGARLGAGGGFFREVMGKAAENASNTVFGLPAFKWLQMASTAAYEGSFSTMRNEPLPLQIYEYFMGGFFAYKFDTPNDYKRASVKITKSMNTDPDKSADEVFKSFDRFTRKETRDDGKVQYKIDRQSLEKEAELTEAEKPYTMDILEKVYDYDDNAYYPASAVIAATMDEGARKQLIKVMDETINIGESRLSLTPKDDNGKPIAEDRKISDLSDTQIKGVLKDWEEKQNDLKKKKKKKDLSKEEEQRTEEWIKALEVDKVKLQSAIRQRTRDKNNRDTSTEYEAWREIEKKLSREDVKKVEKIIKNKEPLDSEYLRKFIDKVLEDKGLKNILSVETVLYEINEARLEEKDAQATHGYTDWSSFMGLDKNTPGERFRTDIIKLFKKATLEQIVHEGIHETLQKRISAHNLGTTRDKQFAKKIFRRIKELSPEDSWMKRVGKHYSQETYKASHEELFTLYLTSKEFRDKIPPEMKKEIEQFVKKKNIFSQKEIEKFLSIDYTKEFDLPKMIEMERKTFLETKANKLVKNTKLNKSEAGEVVKLMRWGVNAKGTGETVTLKGMEKWGIEEFQVVRVLDRKTKQVLDQDTMSPKKVEFIRVDPDDFKNTDILQELAGKEGKWIPENFLQSEGRVKSLEEGWNKESLKAEKAKQKKIFEDRRADEINEGNKILLNKKLSEVRNTKTRNVSNENPMGKYSSTKTMSPLDDMINQSIIYSLEKVEGEVDPNLVRDFISLENRKVENTVVDIVKRLKDPEIFPNLEKKEAKEYTDEHMKTEAMNIIKVMEEVIAGNRIADNTTVFGKKDGQGYKTEGAAKAAITRKDNDSNNPFNRGDYQVQKVMDRYFIVNKDVDVPVAKETFFNWFRNQYSEQLANRMGEQRRMFKRLNSVWEKRVHSKSSKIYGIDLTGRRNSLEYFGKTDFKDDRVNSYRPWGYLEKTLTDEKGNTRVGELTQVKGIEAKNMKNPQTGQWEYRETGRNVIDEFGGFDYNKINENSRQWTAIENVLKKNNKYLMSGINDKDKMLVIDISKDILKDDNYDTYEKMVTAQRRRDYYNLFFKNLDESKISDELKQLGVKDLKELTVKLFSDKQSDEWTQKATELLDGRIPLDPVTLQKRAQLFMSNQPTIGEIGDLSVRLLEDGTKYDETTLNRLADELGVSKDKLGDELDAELMSDGSGMIRQDIFDQLVRQANLPENTSVLKVMVSKQDSDGPLFSKPLYIRADDVTDAEMQKQGIDIYERNSNVKIRGQRDPVTRIENSDGTYKYEKGENRKYKHDFTISGKDMYKISGISSQEYDHDARMIKPVISNIIGLLDAEGNSYAKAAQQKFFDTFMNNDARFEKTTTRKEFQEDMNESQYLNRLIESDAKVDDLTKVNFDNVKLDDILTSIYGKNGHKVLQAFINHMENTNRKSLEVWEEVKQRSPRIFSQLVGKETNLIKKLSMVHEINENTLTDQGVLRQFKERFSNYVVNRLLSRKQEGAQKMFGKGFVHETARQFLETAAENGLGNKYKEMFMLDPEMKDKTIGKLDDGTPIKLDVFLKEWKETDAEHHKVMLENIDNTLDTGKEQLSVREDSYDSSLPEFTIVRTPADAPSAVQVLKLGGFMDRNIGRGMGIYMWQYAMDRLGGADYDGDSFTMFSKMPQVVKDYFYTQRNEFTEAYQGVTKEGGKARNNDDSPLMHFDESDFSPEIDNVDNLSKPSGMGDHKLLFDLAVNTRKSANNKARAVVLKQNLEGLYQTIKFNNLKGKHDYIPLNGSDNGRIEIREGVDLKKMRMELRNLIDATLDAGKFGGMPKWNKLFNRYLDKYFVFRGGNNKEVKKASSKTSMLYNSVFNNLQKMNNFLYGRNLKTGQKYEISQRLFGIQENLKEFYANTKLNPEDHPPIVKVAEHYFDALSNFYNAFEPQKDITWKSYSDGIYKIIDGLEKTMDVPYHMGKELNQIKPTVLKATLDKAMFNSYDKIMDSNTKDYEFLRGLYQAFRTHQRNIENNQKPILSYEAVRNAIGAQSGTDVAKFLMGEEPESVRYHTEDYTKIIKGKGYEVYKENTRPGSEDEGKDYFWFRSTDGDGKEIKISAEDANKIHEGNIKLARSLKGQAETDGMVVSKVVDRRSIKEGERYKGYIPFGAAREIGVKKQRLYFIKEKGFGDQHREALQKVFANMYETMTDYMSNDIKDLNSVIMWNQTMKQNNLSEADDKAVRDEYNRLVAEYPVFVNNMAVSTTSAIRLLASNHRSNLQSKGQKALFDTYMLSTWETMGKQQKISVLENIIGDWQAKVDMASGQRKVENAKKLQSYEKQLEAIKSGDQKVWKQSHSNRLGHLAGNVDAEVYKRYWSNYDNLVSMIKTDHISQQKVNKILGEHYPDAVRKQYHPEDSNMRKTEVWGEWIKDNDMSYENIKKSDTYERFENYMRKPIFNELRGDPEKMAGFIRFMTKESMGEIKHPSELSPRDMEVLNDYLKEFFKPSLPQRILSKFKKDSQLNSKEELVSNWMDQFSYPRNINKKMVTRDISEFITVDHSKGPLQIPISTLGKVQHAYNHIQQRSNRGDRVVEKAIDDYLEILKKVDDKDSAKLQEIATAKYEFENSDNRNTQKWETRPEFTKWKGELESEYEKLPSDKKELVHEIMESYPKLQKYGWRMIKGDPKQLRNRIWRDDDYTSPNVSEMRKAKEEGKNIGLDAQRVLLYELDKKINGEENANFPQMTGEISRYFPHKWKSAEAYNKALETAVEKEKNHIRKNVKSKADMESRIQELDDLLAEHKQKAETFGMENLDPDNPDKIQILDEPGTGYKLSTNISHNYSRNMGMGGYDRSVNAWKHYLKEIKRAYFQGEYLLQSEEIVQDFKERNPEGIDTRDWIENIVRPYIRDTMGYPSVYKDTDGKKYGYSKSPYGLITDQKVMEAWNNKVENLPFGDKIKFKGKQGPQQAAGMMARYNVMRFLASFRFAATNILGGKMNDIINIGFTPNKKAVQLDYATKGGKRLMSKYGAYDIKNKENVQELYIDSGIAYSFLKFETGVSELLKTNKGQHFKYRIEKLLTQPGEDLKNTNILKEFKRMWKEEGLPEAMIEPATKFISKPEWMLRRQSFLAHYIHARDMGYTKEGAMEMGKQGVKSTQFLYDLGNRPMFSRTALGQVLTRFQNWAWNSVSLRNRIRKQAKMNGYQGEAMKRYNSMQMTDMFVFGLATALTSSIFESGMPAPYGWMQDTAYWLFGDEDKRERSFFGSPVGPLQIVTPTILSFPMSVAGAAMNGSWERIINYHMYTLFPYGRLFREMKKTVETPAMLPEFAAGIPMHQIGRNLEEQQKRRFSRARTILDKPMNITEENLPEAYKQPVMQK